ncbi:MAG: hypothetical protein LBJ48_05950 [Coriobacteriales bacterium]|nr:hypothetical protein [Coriobacteriales bacterium]
MRLLLATLVLVLSCALALGGCAPTEDPKLSSEELSQASATVEQLMESVKAKDALVIAPLLQGVYLDTESAGLSLEDFISSFFEGFGFQIVSSEALDESTASIGVTLTTRDGEKVMALLGDAYQSIYETGALSPDYAAVWEETAPATFENPYFVVAEKEGEGWTITQRASLGAALLGGFDPRQLYSD